MEQEYLAMLEAGFGVDEAALYLDTHPKCQDAMEYFECMKKQYEKARREYSAKYGPVCREDIRPGEEWSWTMKPWPWEGGKC